MKSLTVFYLLPWLLSLLFGGPLCQAESLAPGEHAVFVWAPWETNPSSLGGSVEPAWLKSFSDLTSLDSQRKWFQLRRSFGPEWDFSARQNPFSVQKQVQDYVNSSSQKGPLVVDFYLISHGGEQGVGRLYQGQKSVYDPMQLLSDLADSIRKSAVAAKESRVLLRFFLASCHSGRLVEDLNKEDGWAQARGVDIEVYTSTSSQSRCDFGDLENMVRDTHRLLAGLKNYLQVEETTPFDLFQAAFRSLGRNSFCPVVQGGCDRPEVWAGKEPSPESRQMILKAVLAYMKDHSPVYHWAKGKAKTNRSDWWMSQALGSIFDSSENHELKDMVFSSSLESFEAEERVMLKYLRLRFFISKTPGAKRQIQDLLNSPSPFYRALGLDALLAQKNLAVFRRGPELLEKAYWEERKRKAPHFRQLHRIARHFQLAQASPPKPLLADWRQLMMSEREALVRSGVLSCSSLFGGGGELSPF